MVGLRYWTVLFAVGWVQTSVVSASFEQATLSLFYGVEQNDAERIKTSIADGADINAIGPGGQTPLVSAVLGGKEEAMVALLALGPDTSIPEKDGYTILHAAGFQGRAEMIPRLVAHKDHPEGFDPFHFHEDGYHPMHRACWGKEKRHADAVQAFLKLGIPHDLQNSHGKTCMEMTRNPITREYLMNAEDAEEEL